MKRATNPENLHEGELIGKVIAYLEMNGVHCYRHQNSGVLNESFVTVAMQALFDYFAENATTKAKRNKIIKAALANCYKLPSGTKKGVPDIVGFSRRTGVVIGLEIKIGNDKLSKEQIDWKDKLLAAGGRFIEVKEYEQFKYAFWNYSPPKPKTQPQTLFNNEPLPQ